MRILLINKFYHIEGGTERYYRNLTKLLVAYKHDIALFAMHSRDGEKSRWSKYFVSYLPFNKIRLNKVLQIIGRMLYSTEAKIKINQLLQDFNPDIVHLRSIYHHISPSILPVIKNYNIPIVQTLGDYHLISPNYYMFHADKICEISKQENYYKTILHKCVKESYAASLVEVLEKYFHYYLGWERNLIDYFIAPSQFMKNKLVEYGLPSEKIIHIPHFVDYRQYKPNYIGGTYIIYLGRLSPEKGINYLIDAMKILPKIKLIIVGRGDEGYEENLKYQAKDILNIKFIGFKDGYELKKLIANSKFTILPSVWYEVFGLSVLESFASGKPVVASNIGGIPETVKDKFNGLLVKPGNIEDLAEKISYLWNNPRVVQIMGLNAREDTEKYFNADNHYDRLMKIYQKAIKTK